MQIAFHQNAGPNGAKYIYRFPQLLEVFSFPALSSIFLDKTAEKSIRKRVHYHTGKETDTRGEHDNFSEFSISLRVHQVSRAREFRLLVRLSLKLLIVEQRNGIRYTRRIFARGVVALTEWTSTFKSQYMSIWTFYFSPLCGVACFYYGVLCWNVWGAFEGFFVTYSYGFRHATSLVTNTYLNCIKPS